MEQHIPLHHIREYTPLHHSTPLRHSTKQHTPLQHSTPLRHSTKQHTLLHHIREQTRCVTAPRCIIAWNKPWVLPALRQLSSVPTLGRRSVCSVYAAARMRQCREGEVLDQTCQVLPHHQPTVNMSRMSYCTIIVTKTRRENLQSTYYLKTRVKSNKS